MQEAGEVALILHWGWRGAGILPSDKSTPEIVESTLLAAAPMVEDVGRPATTLWQDGFTIAANTSGEDAEASFLAMLNGITA